MMQRVTPVSLLCLVCLLLVAPLGAAAQTTDAGSPTADTAQAGPRLPTPRQDRHIIFDSSVPADLDRSAIEECMADFSSDVLAEYRVYVFSRAEGRRLDGIPSVNDFAERAHKTFQEADWYEGGHRGILLLLDVAHGDTGVETGTRWSMTNFDGFKQSPVELAYDTPSEQICHLAEAVDARLGRKLRRDVYGSRDDYIARLNLVERDLERIDARFEEVTRHAGESAGPDTPLIRQVRRDLPSGRREAISTVVTMIRTTLPQMLEEDAAGLRRRIEDLEEKAAALERETELAASLIANFNMVRRDLEDIEERVPALEERIARRRRAELAWLGADDATAQLDTCRQKQRALAEHLDAGRAVEPSALTAIEHCLSEVHDQIEATSPLNVFLTQFLPALFAILTVLGLILLIYGRFKARSKLQAKIDALNDQWHSDLDYVSTRLRPLKEPHAEAFTHAQRVVDGEAGAAEAGEDVRDIVDAAGLDIALRRRLERAATARQSAGWIGLDDLREVIDLLEEKPIALGDYEEAPIAALQDALERAEAAADAHAGLEL